MMNDRLHLHRTIARRTVVITLLLALGVLSMSARCIERTSTYVDADGYTHITGQMVNDTDIQGTQIMLQGTLYDANDNIVAQKTAPTCPPDTQPHQQTIFDIRFDNPNVPPWTRFEARPISGKTQASPLPSPKIVLFFSDAIRFTSPPLIPGLPITTKDVFFVFRLRNQTDNVYSGIQGCAAVFDNTGKVVFVTTDELTQRNDDGSIGAADLGPQWLGDVYWVAKDVPSGPVQVRVWLWIGPKGAPTSQYQFITTEMITIRPVTP